MRKFFVLVLLVIQTIVRASDPYPKNESIDIRHYQFRLTLNDSSDRIFGETRIDVRFRKSVPSMELDLASPAGNGKGMTVSRVLMDGQPLKFTQQNDRLGIQFSAPLQAGEEKKIIVYYSGIAAEGLIIRKNKFGDRGFFGDNWPNRAHHWLPVIDHPYDKATSEFMVTAPEHYSVVATGEKIEESSLGNQLKFTHYKTAVLLPVKVMTMGVARFAVKYEGRVNDVPLYTWVYPQNRAEGFSDYAVAAKPLDYFSKNIAPFPYEKLANVQSTTLYGGLENAGNIFYYENSVTGKGAIEELMAHEIAHQWFGNSASEADWHHVWLSEGFATYFTKLYLENTYGSQRLMDAMQTDRKNVIEYFRKDPGPIVNTSITNINKVLSTNTYQKASWVLHMLRNEIGDQKFWDGIRQYYQQYQLGNALTDDFRKVMESASGQDLKPFFDQWIFRGGHPVLTAGWTYDPKKKMVHVVVDQKQPQLYYFPLEVGMTDSQGNTRVEKFRIQERKKEFMIASDTKPAKLNLDPNVRLLFEGTITGGATR
jgi:aminopeptidase N